MYLIVAVAIIIIITGGAIAIENISVQPHRGIKWRKILKSTNAKVQVYLDQALRRRRPDWCPLPLQPRQRMIYIQKRRGSRRGSISSASPTGIVVATIITTTTTAKITGITVKGLIIITMIMTIIDIIPKKTDGIIEMIMIMTGIRMRTGATTNTTAVAKTATAKTAGAKTATAKTAGAKTATAKTAGRGTTPARIGVTGGKAGACDLIFRLIFKKIDLKKI
jgi:hypothetical protein